MRKIQIYGLILIMILIVPFVYSSLTVLLDNDDSIEVVENGQDEESSDEQSSEEEGEEEGIHGIEEFLVHSQEAFTYSASKNVLTYLLGQHLYDVFQDLITPPPRFA